MKRIVLISVVWASLAVPTLAQEDTGKSLMEQGAELFFEGLRKEMEPALDELLGMADEFGPAMQSFLQEMGPALAELAAEVKDWSAYEVPEILPNGDIIIRKKPIEDLPEPEDKDEEVPEGATDI
ncbi:MULTISPECIES: hypothetical protein [unclassified Ruegeria]|uniref:hypothetical protein n=1 Tax=unclassified Ruegeria TaxID=2625375 RepID=UPI0014878DB5|nr:MULTISPECIES: hypothetical protein [unclassified Ruegeria]NOD61935.1 hypothetical protein [Ruegeria sp. HKCCD6109]NOD74686.1 hypothetical protein [Ruegeria sp. HKCCD4332]NOD88580.1 hypothetical protein [Ruegeria sp. HKCCD4318]NOD92294.1 hypothetical protein [Ruegeria sp. HKCCD4884]NOE12192.1 hypothetical protein [Ruegeria sp. HKCCD4318-2]